MTRPGERAHGLARRWLGGATLEHIVTPTIADMQWEHERALRSGHLWGSRWIVCRGHLALFAGLSAAAMAQIARFCRRVGRDDDHALIRVMWSTIVAVSGLTILLVLPPLAGRADGMLSGPSKLLVILTLVPQALGVALPAGLVLGIVLAQSGRLTTDRAFRRMIAGALGVSLLTFTVVGWLVPAGNSAFRRLMVSSFPDRTFHIEPGPNEMTFGQLQRQIHSLEYRPGLEGQVRSLRFSYHVRGALAVSPLPLSLFGLGLCAWGRTRWRTSLVGVATVTLTLFLIVSLNVPRVYSPIAMAWVPDLLFCLSGTLLLSRARHLRRVRDGHPSGGGA